jgi:hypothetical protein
MDTPVTPRSCRPLLQETKSILKKQRAPLKRFRKIGGRLQHAVRILPAAKASFTPINNELAGPTLFVGPSRNGEVRPVLLDIATAIRDLVSRPTQVGELVEQPLDYMGYCNTSAFGA